MTAAAAGLCSDCRYIRRVRSGRGSDFVLCGRNKLDPSFAKYPRLPMTQCGGYVKSGTRKMLRTHDVQLEITEQGAGPLVLLLHGFPEGAHSWRHQMPVLADAGYRVVAPNQRGYGASDKPAAIEAYDQIELAADVVGLIDALGEERAIVIGHDWGAGVAWNTALLHPDRVRAVVGMSVPYGGRPKNPPLARMRELFKDHFFYILYFQEPGVAEAELEVDVRRSLRMIYFSGSGAAPRDRGFAPHTQVERLMDAQVDGDNSAWLSPADLDHFTAQFEQSGFRGPLNWYRNFDRSWERTAAFADKRIEAPALFIAGEFDPVLTWSARAVERMPQVVPNLRESILLPQCGHWVQQERPAEVNAALLRFLAANTRP